ncbi:MAG: hypothetical protein NTW19_08165 [Planctomycetota bacterium]|nr:hypothetical protein [Planctomycetota bacterium]
MLTPMLRLIAAFCCATALQSGLAFAQPASRGAPDGPRTPAPEYFHLRQGITFYIANPDGKPFDINIDLKDINTFCRGPQPVLFKVYDPDGNILQDEFIPDDGVESGGYDQAWAGWDHEMWARGAARELGTEPLFTWSAFSDPRKLDQAKGSQRIVNVKNGKKGVYQVLLAGCDDHFVKIALSPTLKFGVSGHPDFFAGHGDQFRTAYLYVTPHTWYTKPNETLDIWVLEHGFPHTRRVSFSMNNTPLELTDITTKKTTKTATAGQGMGRFTVPMSAIKPGSVIKMTSEGTPDGDFLLRVHNIPFILCPDEETAKFIAGGQTICSDGNVVTFPWQREMWDTLKNLKKEDFIVDTQGGEWNKIAPTDLASIGWGAWAKSNDPSSVNATLKAVNDAVSKLPVFSSVALLDAFPSVGVNELALFYLYPIKGNGLYHNKALKNVITMAIAKGWIKMRAGEVIYSPSELNVAYAEGFHWDAWEIIWDMKEELDPAFLKAIQRGVYNIAQRLSCANGLELVLSNGRTTVPMNIYHAYLITGDERMKDLSLRHLARMVNATDGWQSAGSKSGFFKEHFGADGGYCTYPLFQLGRMYNVSQEPEVLKAVDGLCKWMCYVTLPTGDGRYTGPTSWNARIAMASIEHVWGMGFKYIANKSEWAARLYAIIYSTPDKAPSNYNVADPQYEPGKPVPDKRTLFIPHVTRGVLPAKPLPADSTTPFFEDLGDGHEFYCVRRGSYYAIAYAGRRPPFWVDHSLGGNSAFSGGGIAGLYVQGVGTMILGRVNREYGWPWEAWNEWAVPVVVGEYSTGRVFNTGTSRCTPVANKEAWSLTTTGEAFDAPVNFERSYQFNEGSIAASVTIADAGLNRDVFQYREVFRKDSYLFIKQAWEMVPFMTGKDTTITALNAADAAMGALTEQPMDNVAGVEVSNGKGGVRLKFDQARTVRLSTPPNPVRALGFQANGVPARSVQVKIADKLEKGAEATLKYEIVPWVKSDRTGRP